ncbi:hypothetical protein DFR48_102345 [Ciceribacter lividus]|uniref:Uncharacterized protein n=1 Tax=Ciceribacter lividus TaxID=1197950 RepID=A0A6I7HSG9_9HYPH|nr:hypothetical protein [Ciceribacter lividus]RCW27856.1 hypothetical protein DFR48_102345 [Ciceribacter lividus]
MVNSVARIARMLMVMMFFAGLALDIAVPAVVLSAMALVTWLVRNWAPPQEWRGRPA